MATVLLTLVLLLVRQKSFKYICCMPYLYKVEVRDSALNGKGMFTLQDIPKGQPYWSFYGKDGTTPNRAYTRQEMEAKEDEELNTIFHGGFYVANMDMFIQCRDGGEYLNHSDTPNARYWDPPSGKLEDLKAYAGRDIKAGQEICEFYPDFYSASSEWMTALLKRTHSTRYEFQENIRKKYQGQNRQPQPQ